MANKTQNGISFASNKIGGPPSPQTKSPRDLPSTKFSLKIKSPKGSKKGHLSPTYFRNDLDLTATPKTRGIHRLKSSSFTKKKNNAFSKRLSIPSFHVADQILMDLLQEQTSNDNDDDDNDDIDDDDDIDSNNDDILSFIDEEEEDDFDYDYDDNTNTSNNNLNNNNDDDDDDNDYLSFPDIPNIPNIPDIPKMAASTSNTSNGSVSVGSNGSNISNASTSWGMGDDDDDDDDDDFDDDSDILSPEEEQKLFSSFHRHDMKKLGLGIINENPLDNNQQKIDDNNDDNDDDNTNNNGSLTPSNTIINSNFLKINIERFSDDDDDDDNDDDIKDDDDDDKDMGFSSLQLSMYNKSQTIRTTPRKSGSVSESNQTIINFNDVRSVKNRKLSPAESIILVAQELYDTEKLYIAHLINLQYILLQPIITTYFGNDCISSIFYKFLCEIISVSKSFTSRLSIYVKLYQIPQLANWIYFSCKKFNVYSHYAKMYDIFLDRLNYAKDIDDDIDRYIRYQEKKYKTQLNNQKLYSLLVMPVQRLPRYILLLEELIKYTIKDNDVNIGSLLFLELAKSEIQTVSSRVNEMVRQRENRSNLKELVNRFCVDSNNKSNINLSQLVKNNRILVYEGFLYKVRKYKIKYYFHLFSDIIVYSNINNNGLFNIHRIIDLNKTLIIDLPNIIPNINKNKKKKIKKKRKSKLKIWYRFLLKSDQKSFELLTEDEQEKQNWLLLIKAAISRLTNIGDNDDNNDDNDNDTPTMTSNTNNITPSGGGGGSNTPTSMSVMTNADDDDYYAPYWAPDNSSRSCYVCNSVFSMLNRRHHCRRCGNLICASCSKHKKLLINIDKRKPVRICDKCYDLTNMNMNVIDEFNTDNNNNIHNRQVSADDINLGYDKNLKKKLRNGRKGRTQSLMDGKSIMKKSRSLKMISPKAKVPKGPKLLITSSSTKDMHSLFARSQSIPLNPSHPSQSSTSTSMSPSILSKSPSLSSLLVMGVDNNIKITPKYILKYILSYKNKLQILLEYCCRPLMDVVENNKIITEFIKQKRFYNKSKINKKKNKNKKNNKNNKNSPILNSSPIKNSKKNNKKNAKNIKNIKKKKKQEELRKKKKKQLLNSKKKSLKSTDIRAKTILNNLYKYDCCHKTLISMFVILEQIYDIVCLLHSELRLIIFKKQINYEDDMILDAYYIDSSDDDDNDDYNGDNDDNARIGRLFAMYTELFNVHIEYAGRFPEVWNIIINNDNSYLIDFINNVKKKLSLNNKNNFNTLTLRELLNEPLTFPKYIFECLTSIRNDVDSSMVNLSDLDLCISTLTQIIRDLDKEKNASLSRIKLFKLESSFDFQIDLRERGRTLILYDMITKTTKSKHINHSYYFHLFSNVLCYSAKKLGHNNKYQIKKYIYLKNINVYDGVHINKIKKKKSNKIKKRDARSITVEWWEKQVFDNNSAKDNIKSFNLIFDNFEKKKIWFDLLTNLINADKAKYINPADQSSGLKNHQLNRYSITMNKKKHFCGICHSQFNKLFNLQYKCIKCHIPLCESCCVENFYLNSSTTKKIIAPKYLKLCRRCHFHNNNERSCNVLCV